MAKRKMITMPGGPVVATDKADLKKQEEDLGITKTPGPTTIFADKIQVLSRTDGLMQMRFFCSSPSGFQEEVRVMAPNKVMDQVANIIKAYISMEPERLGKAVLPAKG